MGRCGVPDNLPEIDPASKFGEPIQPWGTRRSLTWRLANTDDGITQAAADAAVAAALASWRAESSLLFTKAAAGVTADINIKFQAVDTPGGPNTEWAHNLFGTGTIVMDSTDSWSVTATTPAGKVDFQSVVLHELGHALGLQHSSITGAVMWPFIGFTQQARKPHHDDGTALSVIDDGYVSLPGISARDLSVAALSSGAVQAWGVSTAASGTAFKLYRHDGASWVNDTSKAALRVTVDPTGAPWIIDGAGKVFRKNANSAAVGTWTEVPGKLASDIAIGADGSVWIVGKDGVAPNFNVHKLVGGAWVAGGSKGVHIAVSPLGIPWVVNSAGAVRRLTTSDPATGTWQALAATNTVKDLAINAKGQPWAISTCTGTNCPILALAEQSEILYPDGRVAAAKLEKWIASPNKGMKGLAAGPTTGPWFIDSAGVVLKPVR
jgi:hypothetical protein